MGGLATVCCGARIAADPFRPNAGIHPGHGSQRAAVV
jgi:hypothetical protein